MNEGVPGRGGGGGEGEGEGGEGCRKFETLQPLSSKTTGKSRSSHVQRKYEKSSIIHNTCEEYADLENI